MAKDVTDSQQFILTTEKLFEAVREHAVDQEIFEQMLILARKGSKISAPSA